ncbi:transposable element Tcb1 transposase [Trichonephila clavipes]|nr:transposable element Tcb1 transposase [Trichonephila clavipes]
MAYRDCGLYFRKIGSLVGRNQPTEMRICDRWMQEVSVRTIRRRLQQSGLSARRPLLGLPLTRIPRRLRRQWFDERRMWTAEWNEVAFTDESRICLQHYDGRFRVWRYRGDSMLNSCVMHRLTDPATGIIVWGGIAYHSHTPLGLIADFKYDFWHRTATAASDVVQSGCPVFDDFFQHLWPYIGKHTANVVFQMVKRLWLIRIDQ